jgi:hypothetical protein
MLSGRSLVLVVLSTVCPSRAGGDRNNAYDE